MKPEKKRLRWKKRPPQTGLRSIGARHPGFEYHDGDLCYASVFEHSTRHTGKTGWYWVARGEGIPLVNTCKQEIATEAEAKQAAQDYVKKCLEKV